VAAAFTGAFAREEEVSREALLPEVNRGLPTSDLFSTLEAEQLLTDMGDANLIMYTDSIVYKL
jgi:hypothetical protein